MAEERHEFQADVSRILHIVANSLYTEREIFLRELISNASDACERLRYAAITQPELIADDPELTIVISVDPGKRTLTIADNGIGMNRDDLIESLGTIARSGTVAFLDQLRDDANVAQIGQFGVGFYSAFMVADSVAVTARKAGKAEAWRWVSDGGGSYTIAEAKAARGTTVELSLKKDAIEFLEAERLRKIIKTYSDHVALPIVLEGKDGGTVNTASALWTRAKKDITTEQYSEFYHHVGHAFDDPWLTIHSRVEGKIEYTLLLFVPSAPPFDLFDPQRQHRIKLYVKRVFITDQCEELVPPYLRFLRGIVDSEDLSLNISREMLQNNPLLAKIRTTIVKRVFKELTKKADKAPVDYANFWSNFGAVLKEGLYEDGDHRAELLQLARFRSTASGDELVSFAEYLGRMKDGQKAIYTLSGDDLATLRRSPQLEGFTARGLEVLLLDDPIDDFWPGVVGTYEDKPFQSITHGVADLDSISPQQDDGEAADNEDESDLDTLIALLKLSLGEAVKDVRASSRLTDSPVCLVADESQVDMHLERILKQHKRIETAAARILEINPKHSLIRALDQRAREKGAATELEDAAHLLLDQARIVEGEALADPAAFARRLSSVLTKSL